MNRIIVCGGRDFDDRKLVVKALTSLPMGEILVHGDAKGADKLAAQVWESWGQECEAHPANWKIGPGAGPKRNQEMVDAGARLCIAFPGGAGTADCVVRCERAGIQVRKIVPKRQAR